MEESLNRSQSYCVSPLCALCHALLRRTSEHPQTPRRHLSEPAFLRQGVKRDLPICWRGTKLAGKSCVPLLSNVRRKAARIRCLSSPPDPIRRARSTKSFTLLFAAFRGSVYA